VITTIEWLPVGSIVHVTGQDHLLMVTGYLGTTEDRTTQSDYLGIPYPRGMDDRGYRLFNKADIDQVVYVGLQTPGIMDKLTVLDELASIKHAAGAEVDSDQTKEA